MQEIVDVLTRAKAAPAIRNATREAFLLARGSIWNDIQDGNFSSAYVSAGNRKFTGAPARTAIRCDFLLACKLALGAWYRSDRIADLAQRDRLFFVLRDRERFPHRSGEKFYSCPRCTGKLYECVSQNVFRYIDNRKWKAAIESGTARRSVESRAASDGSLEGD
jgi:hypothetical protein